MVYSKFLWEAALKESPALKLLPHGEEALCSLKGIIVDVATGDYSSVIRQEAIKVLAESDWPEVVDVINALSQNVEDVNRLDKAYTLLVRSALSGSKKAQLSGEERGVLDGATRAQIISVVNDAAARMPGDRSLSMIELLSGELCDSFALLSGTLQIFKRGFTGEIRSKALAFMLRQANTLMLKPTKSGSYISLGIAADLSRIVDDLWIALCTQRNDKRTVFAVKQNCETICRFLGNVADPNAVGDRYSAGYKAYRILVAAKGSILEVGAREQLKQIAKKEKNFLATEFQRVWF